MKPEGEKEQLIYRLGLDPRLAHEALFAHRHTEATPPFHFDLIDDLHSAHPRIAVWAFRNAAKTTRAEEAIIIKALYRRFHNALLIGESEERAAERLAAIKYELEQNEPINELFGSMVGPVWHETRIQMANGTVIQAKGRGQSLRGTKHHIYRPDFVLIDDIENEENVRTPEFRTQTEMYIIRVVVPAMASPDCPVRALTNMLDPDCLVVRLGKRTSWLVKKYPVEYIGKEGERKAMWEAKLPLPAIDKIMQEFTEAGALNEYQQEYMGEATDPSTRVFTTGMMKVEPTVRTWQPTYAMYDPARTVKASSAHTGKVVFSWIGTKLIVWEGDGQLWMPDKIIEDMFATHDQYQPVKIGVEKEGLEEFILQPLRAEQTRRQQIIPVEVLPAPVGKLAFIRSLQPFFTSGDVVFAKELPVLKQQLLSFPTGRIDVPNALAYALRMRPGLPIYENFSHRNVDENLSVLRNTPCYLALGATRQYTTAVLCQLAGGTIRVMADWVREGDPGNALPDIIAEVGLVAGRDYSVFAGGGHFNTYDTVGLQAAARRSVVRLKTGGDENTGREDLRRRIEALAHGRPALLVSTKARWTLNAFSGGYARSVTKGKEVFGMADEGPYKVLMEGFEAFAAATGGALGRDGEDTPNYAIDAKGRRYLSAMPTHRG